MKTVSRILQLSIYLILMVVLCSGCEGFPNSTSETNTTATPSSDKSIETGVDPTDNSEEQIIADFLKVIDSQGCLGFDYWYKKDTASTRNRETVYIDYDRGVMITRHTHIPKSGDSSTYYKCEMLPESFVPQNYATKEEIKDFENSAIYDYFMKLSSDRAKYNFLVPEGYRFEEKVGILVFNETPYVTPTVSPRPTVNSDDPFVVEYYDVEVGDSLIMGKTEQDGVNSNGVEDIVWVVLQRQGNRILLTTQKGILCGQYNSELKSVTWEKSSLRKWLNEDFYKDAFNEREKKRILTTTVTADKNPQYTTETGKDTKDKIYVLSIKEALELFPDNARERECEPCWYMEHDKQVFVSISKGKAGYRKCYWWLRTQGSDGNKAAVVCSNGNIDYDGFDVCSVVELVVRPVMWVSLEP